MVSMSTIRTWFGKASPLGLLILTIVVGVGGAFGAALFHLSISLSQVLFFSTTEGAGFIDHITGLPIWLRLLIPTLGGLMVGLIYAVVKVSEAEGEGVPEVMEALQENESKIRPVVAPVKILTAAITLGSGGSAGREGPIIQIGSAIGSGIAQLARLDESHRRLLLAAGAAAGIGGTFGAPAAGVVFTAEILREKPVLRRTILIALAALVSTFGTRLLLGHDGLHFSIDTFAALTPFLLLISVLLGITAALAASLFAATLRTSGAIFSKTIIPRWLRPACGGFLVGVIGLYLPYVHEPAAYPLMVDLLSITALPLGFLAMLLLAKMLATGITLGSGGSGGIFAPSLLIGTILGSAFGTLLVKFGIIAIADVPTFALIGMGAVFAAAAHAPLTAMFILYEMTTEPTLILPLVLACAAAYATARKIGLKSIYSH